MPGHNALFRFDAGATIGGGHAMRCLTLAAALEARRWTCRFAVDARGLDFLSALAARTEDCLTPEDIETHGPYTAVIADHYEIDRTDEAAWRGIARFLVVVDDLADRGHDCDLLIDQGLNRRSRDYQGLVPPECRLLLGPLHGLLRPEFANHREATLAARRGTIRGLKRVLIAFGLSDPDNLTVRALRGAAGKGLEIDVVLGAGAPHLGAVRTAAMALNPPARVHVDSDDMAGLMAAADLAIGAFGSTSWERCALGLPTIGVIAAENQRANAEALSVAGAAVSMGWHADLTATDFANVLDRPVDLIDQADRAAGLCDGLGADRVAGIITDMAEGRAPLLREARMTDAALLMSWRNDSETRRQSKTTAWVTQDDHLAWLAGVLADPDRCLRIAELANQPVGSVRADKNAGTWMLSWVVAPEARGEGLGRRMVARMIEHLNGDIQAEVRIGNPASARIALAVGMQQKDETDGVTLWTMRK